MCLWGCNPIISWWRYEYLSFRFRFSAEPYKHRWAGYTHEDSSCFSLFWVTPTQASSHSSRVISPLESFSWLQRLTAWLLQSYLPIACTRTKSFWSCDPMGCSPPGSSVHGILQASILEWVAMPSSRGSSWPGIEPGCLMSPELAGGFFTTSATCFIFQLLLTKRLTPRQHPVNLCQSRTSKVKIYHWGHMSCVLKGLHSAEPNLKLYWASGRNSAFMLCSMKCLAKINLNSGKKYRCVLERKSWEYYCGWIFFLLLRPCAQSV